MRSILPLVLGAALLLASSPAPAQPLPGGTLDPLSIPKYVTPLVIPPVLYDDQGGTAPLDVDVAVRQFTQQVLPTTGCMAASAAQVAAGGDAIACNGDAFPATTLWGYGNPAVAASFNNPSFTIEVTRDTLAEVTWINDLQDENGPLPHLFDVDRTLHWSNPELAVCGDGERRTDCRPDPLHPGNADVDFKQPYAGPVPTVTHVHGAHTDAASDGYTEAWYLPASAADVVSPVTGQTYALFGDKVNELVDRDGKVVENTAPGQAEFRYLNDQPSTTLWYHDHALGMTRLNVAAASAGFWLIREADEGETGLVSGVLPGPPARAGDDPNGNAATRAAIREIPLAIQDRSFDVDGSFFYPADRAFFEGLGDGQVPAANPMMTIDFIDDPRFSGTPTPSDISPIWNPEVFLNTQVVNGTTWPVLEVAPERYRLRLLNANDSRFLNLSLHLVSGQGQKLRELPFYMIGAEQGLMPNVVRVETGFATVLPGDGSDVDPNFPDCRLPNGRLKPNCVPRTPTRDPQEALLMGPAERPDAIVDFSGLEDGDTVVMFNTAPDAPFGGFPDDPAHPGTTGQLMMFRVGEALASPEGDRSAPAPKLVLLDQTEGTPDPSRVRTMALLEEGSGFVCAAVEEEGEEEEFVVPIQQVAGDPALDCADATVDAAPFGPQAAVLGNVDALGNPSVQLWADEIEQNPGLGATEEWQFWNFSADAHPIHVHLVGFEVLGRQALMTDPSSGEPAIPGVPEGPVAPALPWEIGFKDTVSALPGEITSIKATFDLPGLYVWHCHILSHEDNEMMVPYCIGDAAEGVCSGNDVAPDA